jgi:hypothetical protein
MHFVAGIAVWQRPGRQGIQSSILGGGKRIFPLASDQSSSEAHPVFYRGPFPGGKTWPGRNADD